MSNVINFPVDTTKVEFTEAQEEVVDKIKVMLDDQENWMNEYYTENEDNMYAEFAAENAESDFDVIVELLSEGVNDYDQSLFDYLASTLSSEKQDDFVDWIHASSDLVHMTGWGSEPYGIILGHCTLGELCDELNEEVLKAASDADINLEHETFSQYCIKGDTLFVDMNYDTWFFRLDEDKYPDAIEYLKELNERRD